MPCNSDYMNPSGMERSLSEVACLLDELAGKKIPRSHWDGYHPRVYNMLTHLDGDALVSELCTKLRVTDVTKYSLEMQMWWRDHKEADRKRIQRELDAAEERKEREKAISKLTDRERQLLGL